MHDDAVRGSIVTSWYNSLELIFRAGMKIPALFAYLVTTTASDIFRMSIVSARLHCVSTKWTVPLFFFYVLSSEILSPGHGRT